MAGLIETVVRMTLDEHRYDEMDQYYHSDFIYVRELEMLDYEQMKRHVIDDFGTGHQQSTNRKTLFEDDLTVVFDHDIAQYDATGSQIGDAHRVRVVTLLQDGLIWRQFLTRVVIS